MLALKHASAIGSFESGVSGNPQKTACSCNELSEQTVDVKKTLRRMCRTFREFEKSLEYVGISMSSHM